MLNKVIKIGFVYDMNNSNDDFADVIGGTAIFLGAIWLLGKLVQNQPIPRCPNCNLVVKNNLRRCPRCGTWLDW